MTTFWVRQASSKPVFLCCNHHPCRICKLQHDKRATGELWRHGPAEHGLVSLSMSMHMSLFVPMLMSVSVVRHLHFLCVRIWRVHGSVKRCILGVMLVLVLQWLTRAGLLMI